MSAIPEFNRTEETGKPDISGIEDDSLSLLPEILRRAAFISSGGRIYRLFSEEDEDAIRTSPLGTPFQINPTVFTSRTVFVTESVEETVEAVETVEEEKPVEEHIVSTTESEAVPPVNPESLEAVLETLDAELEFFSQQAPPPVQGAERKKPNRVDLLSFEAERSELPVEDAIRRMRAVEGICSTRKKSREILTTAVVAEPCEKKAVMPKKTGVPLRSTEDERPSLKLYEVFSNTPSKPQVVEEPISVQEDPPEDMKATAIEAQPIDTVILRLFETPPTNLRRDETVVVEKAAPVAEPEVDEPTACDGTKTSEPESSTDETKPSQTEPPEENPVPRSNVVIRLHVTPLQKKDRPFAPRKRAAKSRDLALVPGRNEFAQAELVEEIADVPEAVVSERNESVAESSVMEVITTAEKHVTVEQIVHTEIVEKIVLEETVEETTSFVNEVVETVARSLNREKTEPEEHERIDIVSKPLPLTLTLSQGERGMPNEERTILCSSSTVHEMIVEEPDVVEESHVDPLVWRLHWEPVWPKYLASLERQASSQIRYLADHLEVQFEQGRKVISFNGYRPGDGCTTLSLCAARELAERGHRLLLADAHCQHPELAMLLELDIHPHVYEIMTLIPDRLELLPWSEEFIEVDSHDETHTKSYADIVTVLRDEYDGILLDGGSLIGSPLAERVAQWRQMQSDGVLLVVNTKNPQPVNVQAVAHRLRQFNIDLLGVAENYV